MKYVVMIQNCIKTVYPDSEFEQNRDKGATGNLIVRMDGKVLYDKKAGDGQWDNSEDRQATLLQKIKESL